MSQFSNRVLSAIANSGGPWVTPARISQMIQCPPDLVKDCLADLETSKMVESWEIDNEHVVTFTPLAAERMNIQLLGEQGWGSRQEDNPLPEEEPSPEITNMTGAIAATPLHRKKKFEEIGLPYPTVLIGEGTALWDNIKYDICPSCNNKQLKTHEYCLRCDRWGMDKVLKNRTSESKVKIDTYDEREVPIAYNIHHT